MSKNSNRELAPVIKRKIRNKNWVWQVQFRDNSGKLHRYSSGSQNYDEAIKIRRELMSRMAITENGTTLGHAKELFFKISQNDPHKQLSTATRNIYARAFDYAIVFFSPSCVLETLTQTDFDNYIIYMQKKGFSHNTIDFRLSSLRSAFKYLIKKNIINSNSLNIIIPPGKKSLKIFMKKEQIINFLNTAFDCRKIDDTWFQFWGALNIYARTGCRVSEVTSVNMKNSGINMESGLLTWRRPKARPPQSPYHTIKMNAELRDIVSLFYNQAEPEAGIFPKLTSRDIIYYRWQILQDICGYRERFPLKCWRDSVATNMILGSAPLVAVKELLGHSTIKTTEKYLSISGESDFVANSQINWGNKIQG